MTSSWLLIAIAGVGALAASAAQTPAPPAPAATETVSGPAGNADSGKKLFVSYGCYQCHGYEGQGGAAGPRIAPGPLPFAVFTQYVRRPTNQMPPYTERVVPNNDLADIHAYLASRPKPAPAESIPLLK
jgi:ubiquinol-cytochrome c reductase cytochrome c subunit